MKCIFFSLLLSLSMLVSCQTKKQNSEGVNTGDLDSGKDSVAVIGLPKLLYSLPEKYNTPDGLCLAPDSSVILSVPNLADNKYPGVLLRLTDDSLSFFASLPEHPDTKHACPMDLAYGPDGNLYYADNQYENDKDYKSRLMRMKIENGKPGAVETVVEGFGLSNAVLWKGNNLYVSDSQWDLPDNDKGSAIFRFTLEELNKGLIRLQPKTLDPHILTTFTTKVNETDVDNGADGIDYDSKGNLYTGSFGDGTLYKMRLKPDGTLASKEVFAVKGRIPCVDGLVIDRKTDNIYLCDSRMNAIRIVAPDGTVTTLAQNGDTDGSGGLLDQPAEVLLKGNRLLIANFDKPDKKYVNTKSDTVHTLSVIHLDQ